MQLKKKYWGVIVALIFLTASGCDPTIHLTYRVTNKRDHTIKVTNLKFSDQKSDTVSLNPGATLVLGSDNEFNASGQGAFNRNQKKIDSLKFFTQSGKIDQSKTESTNWKIKGFGSNKIATLILK